jgi:hypothetical protein
VLFLSIADLDEALSKQEKKSPKETGANISLQQLKAGLELETEFV